MSQVRLCPLRVVMHVGNDDDDGVDVYCCERQCAWWSDDFGECAIAALASVATQPIVARETLAGRGWERAASEQFE